MPFEIVRNDIVNMKVDAVVNTANPNPVIGSGVDSGIHKKAGYEMLVARQKIGCIDFGDAVITPGFNLDAKYVIHTVGPVWEDGNHGEEQILSSCYRKSLALANGKLHEEFQSGYICPIYFGMLTEAERLEMGKRLAALAEKNDYKIETGFLGTPYLLFALSDTGHTDTAYRVLLNEECPGWLYPVKLGATTIWERWDALRPDGTVNLSNDYVGGKGATSADFDPEDQSAPSMTSFNHYAYGAVGDWLYRRVAGLEAMEPGWKRFRVQPMPGGGLTWAEAYTETPFGQVRARWEIRDGSFELRVDVPEGAACEAVLPDGTKCEAAAGSHCFTCVYGGGIL
ncbi:MAG: macro domain-containing protein [Eubacteriales bacterium]|nr:macro domain-containing protein [Eubacteriales bacterium]